MRALTSAYKTDQADFTDWISFVPSNLTEEISPNKEASTQIPKVFHQHEKSEKKMM